MRVRTVYRLKHNTNALRTELLHDTQTNAVGARPLSTQNTETDEITHTKTRSSDIENSHLVFSTRRATHTAPQALNSSLPVQNNTTLFSLFISSSRPHRSPHNAHTPTLPPTGPFVVVCGCCSVPVAPSTHTSLCGHIHILSPRTAALHKIPNTIHHHPPTNQSMRPHDRLLTALHTYYFAAAVAPAASLVPAATARALFQYDFEMTFERSQRSEYFWAISVTSAKIASATHTRKERECREWREE